MILRVIRGVTVLALSAMLAASAGAQASRRFAFRTMQFGDSIGKLSKYTPCTDDKHVPGLSNCMLNKRTIAGHEVDYFYDYVDGRLARFTLLFSPDAFADIAAAFTFAYGVPKVTAESFTTRSGAQATNSICRWTFSDSEFELKEFGPSLEQGAGVAADARALTEITRRRTTSAKQSAEKDIIAAEQFLQPLRSAP